MLVFFRVKKLRAGWNQDAEHKPKQPSPNTPGAPVCCGWVRMAADGEGLPLPWCGCLRIMAAGAADGEKIVYENTCFQTLFQWLRVYLEKCATGPTWGIVFVMLH